MKSNHKSIGLLAIFLFFAGGIFFSQCSHSPEATGESAQQKVSEDDYTVAAYYWPSLHDESRSRKVFWSEGIGEWEMVQKARPRFEGHYQPRIPLWGYEMGDNPEAMEKKIDAAADHGVDAFIFDWYWFDGKPFLEETVNNGFLKADNNDRLNFYLMWANHDAKGYWNHWRYDIDSLIWEGTVDWKNFRIVVDRVITKYFGHSSYMKIDGKPVFSIFSFGNLVESFEGIEGTKKALDYFRDEVKKAGFPGLHLQVIGWGRGGDPFLLGGKYARDYTLNEIISTLGINSVTTYNWTGSGLDEDYLKWAEGALALRQKWDQKLNIPYVPNVSVGWDNTPRFPEKGKESVVHIHKSPESFGAYLQRTKDYVKTRPDQPGLITVNAWNEWIEGSYLEPDMRWGYEYLETVKEIMSGKYEEYH